MKQPSFEHFAAALATGLLSETQIKVLLTLYQMPGSSAHANELAQALNYKSHGAANLRIGEIGRKIGETFGYVPETYFDHGKTRHAWFQVISEWTDNGWTMHSNLKTAIKQSGLL